MLKVISAHTTYPNTPESDLKHTVLHTVHYEEDGIEKEIMLQAACPISAIEKAKRLLGEDS